MKNKKYITLSFLLLTLISSCGKKSKDNNSPDSIIDNSVVTEEKNSSSLSLYESIKSDNLEKFKTLIRDNIIDINAINSNGNTLLIDSIILSAQKIRDYLLERGVNFDVSNEEGFTPLIMAVSLNHVQTARLLINKGALLDKKNDSGDTALHIAIKKEYEALAIILVESGANIKITDYDNLTAYDLTITRNLPDLEELLKKMTLIDLTPPDLYTFKEIILNGQISTLKETLEKYLQIVSTYDVINPLCLALEIPDANLRLEMAQLLIENKASSNGPLNAECIPLIEAIKLEDVNFVKLLLENKARAHILDQSNLAPLIYAIKKNNLEMVKLLVSYKALLEYKFVSEEGDQEDIDACDVVRSVGKTLKTSQDRKINKKIKEHLNCGFWDWLF